jgi:hypothetical protein
MDAMLHQNTLGRAEWVVTYRMMPRNCATESWSITEFFRGSEEECRRIMNAFAGGESDKVRTNPWNVIIGPAEAWDEFLSAS